jgi:alcohol dehydrogenase class IV
MLRLLRVPCAARGALRRVRFSTSKAGPLTAKCDIDARQLSASGQPYRVVVGAKAAVDHLGAIARSSGIHKMLVVRDRDAGAASRTQYAEFLLMQAGIPCFQYTLQRDCATLKDVDDGVATALRVGADGVLAFGGGSTMDMARAIALVLTNGGEAEAYVQVRSSDRNHALVSMDH